MKTLWLFDFDGVIADSFIVFEEAVRQSLLALGYDFLKTKEDFLDLFRNNLYISLANKGVPQDDLVNVFARIESSVDFSSIGFYDGIIETIKEIKKFVNIAIVSSNREAQIKEILKANNVLSVFPMVLGVESGTSKVDKIGLAIKRYKAGPSDTCYVIDTIGDLIEAKGAGVKSVAVGWGWHKDTELKAFGPDYFVSKPVDLLRLVKEAIK